MALRLGIILSVVFYERKIVYWARENKSFCRVGHDFFFYWGLKKIDLFALKGSMKRTLWPASEKTLFYVDCDCQTSHSQNKYFSVLDAIIFYRGSKNGFVYSEGDNE